MVPVEVVAAGALALFAFGAGRLSLDGILLGIGRRRRARKAALKSAPAATPEPDVTLIDDGDALDETPAHLTNARRWATTACGRPAPRRTPGGAGSLGGAGVG